MGKNKRKILNELVLLTTLLFASCDVFEVRKPYLDAVVESHWQNWCEDGKDSLNCYIDFAEALDFSWDTMIYFSGESYLSKYLKVDSVFAEYMNILAAYSNEEQVAFFLGDSVVHRMTFFPEYDFNMEVVPKGVCFCTKKFYFKLARDNAKFHIVKRGLQYRLYHMDDTFEEETLSVKDFLSPYVGRWEWIADNDIPRKVDVIIGERCDSLLLAFSWNFMDKSESDFYTTDFCGLPLACTRILRPDSSDVATGKIFNTFLSVHSLYVKEFEDLRLSLRGNDTLVWSLGKEYLWPDSLILVRRNNFNYKFSDYIPYIPDDVHSLQRLIRGLESLDFTY